MAAAFSTVGAPASTPTSFLGKKLKKQVTAAVNHHGKTSNANRFKVMAKEDDDGKQTDQDRWRGLAYDISDDQQDIVRGKGIVDSLFQAPMGGGTHEAVLSSFDYLSQGLRTYNMDNTLDGLYIAPAFMDKLVVHLSKNFMTLPNIKARHVSHAFLVDSAFPDEFTRCAPPAAAAGMVDTTRLRDFPRSNLTMCNHEFEPRKRARVAAAGDGFLVEDLQRVSLLPPAAVAQGSCTVQQVPVGRAADVASGSSGLLLWRLLYNQGADIDAFIRLESERMRVGLEEQRRRYTRALLAAASGRLRAAEAELERALRRNAELEDRARQAAAECEAWAGLARGHEVVAAGLRATLNQLLLQSPCAATVPVGEGDAEDAQSCCFEPPDGGDGAACQSARAAASSCKACRGAEACVLLLPCRHLCLCQACDAAVDACPVCTAAKNSSLHVLLS